MAVVVPQIPATTVDVLDTDNTFTLPWRKFLQYVGTLSSGTVTPADIAALTTLAQEALADAQSAVTTANEALAVAEAASGGVTSSLDPLTLLGIASAEESSLELEEISTSLANVSSSVVGISTSFVGVSSSLTGVSSSLGGVSTSLNGVSSSVTGVSTSVVGLSTSLVGVSTSVVGLSTSLGGVSTSLTGVSTSLGGVSTSLATSRVPLTFGTLPGSPIDGQPAFITDASATTFASVAAGGGTNHVPVYYDGSLAGWRIG